MKKTKHTIYNLTRHRLVHAVLLAAALLSIGLQNRTAHAADLLPDDFRVGEVLGDFDDVSLFAIGYKLRSPRRLRAQYLELAVGAFETTAETRSFVSFGPVWRVPLSGDRFSLKLGVSPTLFDGSRFGTRDIGGNFHFTSSASLEASFGLRRAFSVALRIQHTSNAGLNGTNPGLDIIGLNFSYRPR